jgi:pyruvate dehydrogenase E2 component (dihydrolipoamide acetyltransferase)
MDIKLPRLGEGADSGTVVNILVNVGDAIKKDQPILELETEKAVGNIPSPESGTVTKIYVKVGDTISAGQPILSLSTPGATETKIEREAPKPAPTPTKQPIPTTTGDYVYASKSGAPPPASPSVRRLARQLGVDLTRVRGSERGGRITLGDIKSYIERLQQRAAAPQKVAAGSGDFAKWGPISKKPMSNLRKVIARRMVESWTTIPHVTQFDDADITEVSALKDKFAAAYKEKGAKLTLTPFLLKAVVAALQKNPMFNSSLDEATDEIVHKNYYHIGIAVDTEAGLLVPVLRDVDKKSMLELAKELDSLAEKAKQRKISADEMRGGTFTISNQGGIGGAHFTPIINKPEVAILGIGRGAVKAVVKGDKIEHRIILPVCVSYDHRVIDGANAVRFTRDFVESLEKFDENLVKL